jgi:HTH-type transcriptional regulator/antitoxin HigA
MTDTPRIEIQPILDEDSYDSALEKVAGLMAANPADGSPDYFQMDILATLIEKYEETHYPMATPDPLEAIKFRMEQSGLKRKDLEDLLGGPARVTEIMQRKRNLSITMIRKLNKEWHIPAESLIQEIRDLS